MKRALAFPRRSFIALPPFTAPSGSIWPTTVLAMTARMNIACQSVHDSTAHRCVVP